MKRTLSFILASMVLLFCLTGCNSTSLPKEPDEFSFSLTWGTYGISSYNSTTGELVKTNDTTRPEDYITTYHLSEDELDTIYALIRKLDIESYPDIYDPNPGTGTEPPATIILEVHTKDVDKTITAKDIAMGYDANNNKGQKFLETVKAIKDILIETDEWKAFPEYEFFYY